MKIVRWEIDVDCATPEEAAETALRVQRDPDSTAVVFDVTDEKGECTQVDLMPEAVPEDQELRIGIILKGGLVRSVVSGRSGVRAMVLDLDIEGSDDEEPVTLESQDRLLEGYPCEKDTYTDAAFITELFNTLNKEN